MSIQIILVNYNEIDVPTEQGRRLQTRGEILERYFPLRDWSLVLRLAGNLAVTLGVESTAFRAFFEKIWRPKVLARGASTVYRQMVRAE
jgi:hypothetical protein